MASALIPHQEFEEVSEEQIALMEHLQGICASKAFENSVTLKNLLLYLFKNRNEKVSEYTVAVEGLHRNADFDSQIDASVRVQISRLRRRLREYYQSEGRSTTIRFFVPLGTHQLILEQMTPGTAGTALSEYSYAPPVMEHHSDQHPHREPEKDNSRWAASSGLTVGLMVMVIVLAVLCGWLGWKVWSQTRAASADVKVQLLPLWQEFGQNGKPARIVIPNPTFFSWSIGSNLHLMARDTEVNDFSDIEKSPPLAKLQKQLGAPQLSEYYTVSSDVIASLKLTQYLEARNVSISTTISSNTASDQFEGENVILLGTPGTLAPYRSQLERLYFKFDPQARLLINPQPLAGEKREYRMTQQSSTRSIYPGLVAFMPGISKDSRLLIFAGSETDALVSYMTSDLGSRALEAARKNSGGAPFFEAVVLSEVDGNTVLNNKMVAFRPFTPKQ
jgi:hypothetical protein